MTGVLLALSLGALGAACATTVPFTGAERGDRYSLDEFEKHVFEEKTIFLETERRNRPPALPPPPGVVKLTAFTLRKFPTASEWAKLKAKAKPGDSIGEFHHRLSGKSYDGPPEATRRGYALLRGDRIVAFVEVTMDFPKEYEKAGGA